MNKNIALAPPLNSHALRKLKIATWKEEFMDILIRAEGVELTENLREAVSRKMAEAVRRNDDLAAQMSEAASNYTVALQRELAAEERCDRLAANFENFKRRTAQEIDKRAAEKKDALVRDLLPVIDNLERAVASSSVSFGHLHEGIQIIWQQLIQVLHQHGFEMRSDLDQPFDPKYHDAVSTRAEPVHADHAILEVWQRGWLRGTDLFRPAKVVVNQLCLTTMRRQPKRSALTETRKLGSKLRQRNRNRL